MFKLSWDGNDYIKYKVKTFKKKMIYLNYEQKRVRKQYCYCKYWASETSKESFQQTYKTMISWVSLRFLLFHWHSLWSSKSGACVTPRLVTDMFRMWLSDKNFD